MKRIAFIAGTTLLILAACASAPEPVEPPDEERAEALALRDEIADNDLAQFAETEAATADEAFAAGETAYEAQDFETARASYNEAISGYRTVISEGYAAIVGSRRTTANDERERAREIRADVAAEELFQTAEETLAAAQAAEEAGNATEAATLYQNAATEFGLAYERAAALRQQALDAVGRVDTRRQELDAQREELENQTREELDDATGTDEGA